MKKVFADLKKWNGQVEKKEIKKSWVDDIVFAVEGQFRIKNKGTGLDLNGGKYSHVDIYEVEE